MTPIATSTRVQPAPGVFFREFEGDLVVLHLSRGEYYGLDEIGAAIWHGLVGGRTPVELSERIAADYDVDAAQALTDILALAGELEAAGLVVVS